jgi:hypothetical protein
VVFAAVCGYLLLTIPTDYPAEWDQINQGMERDTANAILSPWDWQKENSGYMLERRSRLRLWRIDVFFMNDQVSKVTIYHEDPHETFLNELGYFLIGG